MASVGVYEFNMSTGHREQVATVKGHGRRLVRRAKKMLAKLASQDHATDHTYYIGA